MPDFVDRVRGALTGRYEIERELGAGGSAVVLLATDTNTSRKVAIKVLRPDVAALMGHERFIREIQIAGTLVHPHILPLHDAGQVSGLFYYVMPFVEEETLRARIAEDGAMPVGVAVRIGRELAAGLAYAHERGVVHRDVKPGNIFLTKSHATLGDFGVATALASAATDDLTASGVSVGTLAYMSPEQIDGGAVDHRSDLYALGCVLYEMLTGDPPFGRGASPAVLARKVGSVPAALSTTRSDVSRELSALVAQCLEKRVDDRPASAGEVERRLEELSSRSASPPARVRVSRGFTLAATALVAVVGFFALLRPDGADAPPSSYIVIPVRSADWSAEVTDEVWGLAREVTRQLSQWEGIRAVPNVALAGPIFDLGFADRTPGTLDEASQVARRLGAGSLIVLDARVAGDSLDVEVIQVDPDRGVALDRTLQRQRAPVGQSVGLAAPIALELLELTDADTGVGDPFLHSGHPGAIRAFSAGRRALDRWELGTSREALENAVALDPAFALAHHHLALALYWEAATGGPRRLETLGPSILRHTTRARDNASRLTDRDRRHVDAFHAFVQGDFAAARLQYERILEEEPTDSYAHLLLGSVEFKDRIFLEGPRGPHPRARWDRAITSFESAVRLSPDFSLGYGHLFDAWRQLSDPLQCQVFWPNRGASVLIWESQGFDDIMPFCPVLADSIRFAPLTEQERPDHGDGRLLRQLEESAHRQLLRWASYAQEQARPLEELSRWALLVRSRLPPAPAPGAADSLGATALDYQMRALGIRSDTTDYDRAHLASLYLAAGQSGEALRKAQEAQGQLSPQAIPTDFAAHPFLATGRTAEAVAAVTAAYRGGRIAALTTAGTFVPLGDAEPIVLTLQVLGAAGADPPATREPIERLLELWSPEVAGEEASSALRGTTLPRVAPALIEHDDLMEAWFTGLDPRDLRNPTLRQFWVGWQDPMSATASLEAGVRALAEPGVSPTAIYLYGRLAAQVGAHDVAIGLFDRLQVIALPVLGEFHAGWGLRNEALMWKVLSLDAAGRGAEIPETLGVLEERWRFGDENTRRRLVVAGVDPGARP